MVIGDAMGWKADPLILISEAAMTVALEKYESTAAIVMAILAGANEHFGNIGIGFINGLLKRAHPPVYTVFELVFGRCIVIAVAGFISVTIWKPTGAARKPVRICGLPYRWRIGSARIEPAGITGALYRYVGIIAAAGNNFLGVFGLSDLYFFLAATAAAATAVSIVVVNIFVAINIVVTTALFNDSRRIPLLINIGGLTHRWTRKPTDEEGSKKAIQWIRRGHKIPVL